jgi:histone-arginine methyltransferase CARM1
MHFFISAAENTCSKLFDFEKIKCDELLDFSVNLEYSFSKPIIIHGIASWFDTNFNGTSSNVILSTSPYNNPTHWYQIRLLLPEPIAVNRGQKCKNYAFI